MINPHRLGSDRGPPFSLGRSVRQRLYELILMESQVRECNLIMTMLVEVGGNQRDGYVAGGIAHIRCSHLLEKRKRNRASDPRIECEEE